MKKAIIAKASKPRITCETKPKSADQKTSPKSANATRARPQKAASLPKARINAEVASPPRTESVSTLNPIASAPLPSEDIASSKTKKSLLISLLQRPEGATIENLGSELSWLPHTVRASLSGLRKAGYQIACERQAGKGPTIYSLTT